MSECKIIDGVNVAGCIYYQDGKLADCGMFHLGDFKCEGQICLYKQLQKSKQEIETYQQSEQEAKEIIAELKHKNKELKSEKEKILKLAKEGADANEFCLQELEHAIEACKMSEAELKKGIKLYEDALKTVSGMLEAIIETNNIMPLKTNLCKIKGVIDEVFNNGVENNEL
ncbi:MAG: hypothetical protein IJ681_00350 [Bacteroidales bacterium]|nr:hypothetical protein [Bacteroidales bacterium]